MLQSRHQIQAKYASIDAPVCVVPAIRHGDLNHFQLCDYLLLMMQEHAFARHGLTPHVSAAQVPEHMLARHAVRSWIACAERAGAPATVHRQGQSEDQGVWAQGAWSGSLAASAAGAGLCQLQPRAGQPCQKDHVPSVAGDSSAPLLLSSHGHVARGTYKPLITLV